MKKSALLVGLFVLGILIGLSLRNPFRSEGSSVWIRFEHTQNYCFAVNESSGSITYVGKAPSWRDCLDGKAVMPVMDLAKQ